ncbi:MAG: 1-(5-phosphoribosyl)-5-((5-phosphoribosylamino)methylideneamino)imidazole-4-carboxamide isomerase, partial [Chloroflexi bacterium]|nr:1-(5-phosphoribosyl)-5-((5-phosphoribosylamino)methylideneamino)imidazole-4-carboxamide isomerase [Chloroflexota bacterium]
AERIAVGIDARGGRVAVRGWVEVSPLDAVDLARQMAAWGLKRAIYTDVERDGMLQGVNIEATRRLARASGLRIIASGGVASLEDIRALKACEPEGIEGVIIGMALYRGAIRLREAIEIAEKGA